MSETDSRRPSDNEISMPKVSKLKEQHLKLARGGQGTLLKRTTIIEKNLFQRTIKILEVNYKRIAYQCYFFIFSLSILAMSSIVYVERTVHQQDFFQILNNWNSEAIFDIKFTKSNRVCSDAFGSEYSELMSYNWPGTLDACDCTQGTLYVNQKNLSQFYSQNFQINQICTEQQIKDGCSTVYSVSSKQFTMWSDGEFGMPFALCAKRLPGVNFRNNIAKKNYKCSSDQVACGKGNYTFCVAQNQTCPITRIGFTQDQYYEKIKNGELNGTILQVSDALSIYYTLEEKMPIGEIRVSEGSSEQGICYWNNDSNISPNRTEYTLMKTKRTLCSSDNQDHDFQRIHSVNEIEFFVANNNLYLGTQLPYYQISSKYTWGVFIKEYIDWQCRNDMEDIIDAGNNLGVIYIALRIQLIITIIYFIVIGVILSLAGLASAFNHNFSFMQGKQQDQYKTIFMTEILVKIPLELLEISSIVASFVIVQLMKLKFQEMLDKNCSRNPIVISVFKTIVGDLYDYVWSYNLAVLVIFMFVLFGDLFFLIYYYKKIETFDELCSRIQKFYKQFMTRGRKKVTPEPQLELEQ